jgi:hypothetical protein
MLLPVLDGGDNHKEPGEELHYDDQESAAVVIGDRG